MATQDPAQVARGLVAAFNDGDWDTVRDNLTSDSVYDEVGTSRRLEGVDTIIGALHGWKEAMPDVKGTVASSLTAGNTAVLEVSWTGTQTGPMATPSGTIPASGKQQTTRASWVLEVAGGKVKQSRQYFDMLSFMHQIGALPG